MSCFPIAVQAEQDYGSENFQPEIDLVAELLGSLIEWSVELFATLREMISNK